MIRSYAATGFCWETAAGLVYPLVGGKAGTNPPLECFINTPSSGFRSFPQDIHPRKNSFPARITGSPVFLPARTTTLPLGPFGRTNMRRKKPSGNLYQFPLPLVGEGDYERPDQLLVASPPRKIHSPGLKDVVLSGTFRRDPDGLRLAYQQLSDLGFNILSPGNVSIESEQDGFVYMEGESRYSPQDIESRHLDAIQRSAFVWLHAPDGYVGISGSLEVGFARAVGVPVYTGSEVHDPVVRQFVQKLESLDHLLEIAADASVEPPRPPIKAFQNYYKRAALQRGYDNESARDTLILMLEEFGELARCIRKRNQLTRHGSYDDTDEGLELADVFLYVIHLANVLKVDLGSVVQQKELLNIRKFEKALAK